MDTSHKFDLVTACCIYCHRTLEQQINEPKECKRIMKPVWLEEDNK